MMAHISKLRSAFYVISSGSALFVSYSILTGNSQFYQGVLLPSVGKIIDGETSHRLVVQLAKNKLFPRSKQLSGEDSPLLKTSVWGIEFSNPVGLAAGFDKHGECMDAMINAGFGFVEVGSVTPEPQPGNPTPRVFRLVEDKAVINRYGFNSEGHAMVCQRVNEWRNGSGAEKILGINLGKNKETSVDNTANDYAMGIEKFYPLADYLVINISSPNTPGLREWQSKDMLATLIATVTDRFDKLRESGVRKPALLLKISCDLDDAAKRDIASVVLRSKKIDGLIVSNTSASRPTGLKCVRHAGEAGGLSGPPIREQCTQLVRDMYTLTNGQIPIVGCGGVFTGEDAYEKVKAGASLVQLYTGLVYQGPLVARDINTGLAQCLRRDGYKNIREAVGADHHNKSHGAAS